MKIHKEVIEHIKQHAEETYPFECCGMLVSSNSEKADEVDKAFRTRNMVTTRQDRYEIDPEDYLKIEKMCRDNGWEIVGFYHSHPDHPAAPSEFDRQRAWPQFLYLIVKVENGKMVDANGFIMTEENSVFHPEALEII